MKDPQATVARRWPGWSEVQQMVCALPGQTSMVLMALAGSAIALYLTSVHYTKVPLICSATGLIDCASVLTSPYSVLPGTSIPVTLPGLAWFVVSGGLALTALFALWRRMPCPSWLFAVEKIWGGIGVLTILYLIYAEIVKLHHLCAWCTAVHALVLTTFLVAISLPSAPMPLATTTHQAPRKAARPSLTDKPRVVAQHPNRRQPTSKKRSRARQ